MEFGALIVESLLVDRAGARLASAQRAEILHCLRDRLQEKES